MPKPPAETPGNSTSPDGEPLPPFEQAVDQIQRIIDDVESGDVPLADSLKQYERGMTLLRHCRGVLDEAEKKIKTLTLDEIDGGGDAAE